MYSQIDQRPWGHFERFTKNEKTSVKLLYINAQHRLSYQYHKKRGEYWKLIRGRVLVTINGKTTWLYPGHTIFVPKGAKHRIKALVYSIILEIAIGDFDEDDIVRLADDYERC